MTVNVYDRGPRGSGRTSRQIMEAPRSSIYIWPNADLSYPMNIARVMGRHDLVFHWVGYLERDTYMLRGVNNWVVVDHSVALSETAWGAVLQARRRCEEWEAQQARAVQEKVDAEAPSGPYAHVPYQLMAAVAYINQPGDMRPEAAGLYRPTMRIAWLGIVVKMLEELKKPQKPSRPDAQPYEIVPPIGDYVDFYLQLTREEIARLRNPAMEQVRQSMKQEEADGDRD